MRSFLATALCLAAAAPGAAQVYRFRAYDTGNGLPSNAIYAIAQDRHGYMWFATDAGAARYDGARYAVFGRAEGLADPSVRAIAEDRAGILWFATKGGISRWDGAAFTTLTHAQGLASDEVRAALAARDGSLWFGTSRGLSHYDGRAFRNYGQADGLPAGPVWTLLEDRRGRLWAGIRGGGLVRREGERFVAYGKAEGLDPNVFGLAEDRDGSLWIATDGGLLHLEGERLHHYGAAAGLPTLLTNSVLVDRYGRVWCGTFGGGIARLEAASADGRHEQERFTTFRRSNGLRDEYLTSLYSDREGNMWFGTLWSGAFRLSGEQFTAYTGEAGLPEGIVTGLAEDAAGRLWFSSINDGLYVLEPGGKARRFGSKEGLPDERLFAVCVDRRGRVWLGGPSGDASYLERGAFQRLSVRGEGIHDRVNAIAEDREGRIWFGSGAASATGIVAWDGTRFTRLSTADGLAHNQVNDFFLDRDGGLWVATENGVSRWDGTRFTSYGVRDGIPVPRVTTVYQDAQARLWIGTPEGLGLRDGERFRVFTTRDGLVDNFVASLVERQGILWVGTARGVSAWDGTGFRGYTIKDGLLSQQFTISSSLVARDGSLWFGTARGAARYRPVPSTVQAQPPLVHVTALTAQERAIPLGGTVELPAAESSVAFDFVGLSFTDEEAVRYSSMLEGLDTDWSPPAELRSVRFSHLPPGSYTFLVKARSPEGLWSAPAAIPLEVLPPWWQTWWFRLLSAAVGLGLVLGGYAFRLRAVEQRHQLRMSGLRQMLESIRSINAHLELRPLLEDVALQAAALVDGLPRGVGLIQGGNVVFERLWNGREWERADLAVPLGEGTSGRVAATGRSEVSPEGRVLAVPILDRERQVMGVLAVQGHDAGPPFGEAERQLMEAFAEQAGVCIDNARVHTELQEKKVMYAEALWATEELFKHEQELTGSLEELNRMKNNFMIVTSHEMRTPLTVLKGYHEALLQGVLGALSAAQQRSVSVCQKTIDRLISSLNEILQMLAIDEGYAVLKLEPLDPRAAAEQVLAELGSFVERRQQHITLVAPDELPALVADPEKLHLVLLNVLENAIKFTPDGGEIQVRLAAKAASLTISVEDTGIGIEAAELTRIFDKFYTCPDAQHHTSGTYQFKARGNGLGLAIAKGYVEAHGGRIWAESDGPDRGSRFHVVLPLGGPPVTAAGPPGPQ